MSRENATESRTGESATISGDGGGATGVTTNSVVVRLITDSPLIDSLHPDTGARRSSELAIDLHRLRVSIDGKPVSLDGLQLRLLLHFAHHPDCVFSRTQLLADVWGAGERDRVDPKAVDVLVCRLRKRLRHTSRVIQSIRGHGYRFVQTGGSGQMTP